MTRSFGIVMLDHSLLSEDINVVVDNAVDDDDSSLLMTVVKSLAAAAEAYLFCCWAAAAAAVAVIFCRGRFFLGISSFFSSTFVFVFPMLLISNPNPNCFPKARVTSSQNPNR